MTFSVLRHITGWLGREKLGDDKPPSLYPSNACAVDKDGNVYGSCRRQQFLSYMMMMYNYYSTIDNRYASWKKVVDQVGDSKLPPSVYMRWIWEQGELIEQHVLDLIKESGIFVATQTQVYIPKFNVSGRIDAISLNPYSSKYIINEIKSVYGPNADKVLGSQYERRDGRPGTPRDKNMMQLAIYDYKFADEKEFEESQLLYLDRGGGKFAAYQVKVDKKTGDINYRQIDPSECKWEKAPYTIFDILKQYELRQIELDTNVLPARDFSIKYSMKEIEQLVDEGYLIYEVDKEEEITNGPYQTVQEFIDVGTKNRKFIVKVKANTKADISKQIAEQYVKYADRKANGGRQVKEPESGSYMCEYCDFKKFCFNDNGEPIND